MRRNLTICLASILLVLFAVLLSVPQIAPAVSNQVSGSSPVLILDAGHGGEDGGALTASGKKESEINLEITLKLHALMAFLGINTILTRNSDISIHDADCTTLREKKTSDLKNRAKLVNSIENAMLLSVHQNTFTDPRFNGAQVFFSGGEISVQWANYTQWLFQSVLDPNNYRKTAAAPDHIYLLQHISCPALLVECGFLSNGEEAALLMTHAYQRKIVMILAGSYIHQLQMIPVPLGGE